MTTDTGMWCPNGIAQATHFATLGQQFRKLRLQAKWYAFLCRRNGDKPGEAFWMRSAAAHAAAIAQMLQTLTPATAGRSSRDAAGDSNPLDRAVAGSYQESA